MRKLIYFILFCFMFSFSYPILNEFNKTTCIVYAQQHHKSKKNRKKTVHVKSYKTKKGKKVKSYKRRPPRR